MSFLSYGSAKGLAYRHDYGADMDRLYEQEKYKGQLQAQKEEKARYYAEIMKQHNPVAPGIVKGLEEHVQGVNQELVDFAINNPNWEQDPGLFSKFRGITDKYLNNDYVLADLKSQEQLKVLEQRRNEGVLGDEEYEKEYSRYLDFYERGGDPYVFNGAIDPSFDQMFDDTARRLASSAETKPFQSDGLWYSRTDIQREGRNKTGAAMKHARSDYADPVKRRVIDKKFREVSEENPGLFKNALHMYSVMLDESYGMNMSLLGGQMGGGSGKGSEDATPNLYFETNIASGYRVGESIPMGKAAESFSPVFRNTSEPVDFRATNTEVYIMGSDGEFKQIDLQGSWKLEGISQMKVTSGGSYMAHTIQSPMPTDTNQAGVINNVVTIGDKTYRSKTFEGLRTLIAEDYPDFAKKGQSWNDQIVNKFTEVTDGFAPPQTLSVDIGRGKGSYKGEIKISRELDENLTSQLNEWGFHSKGLYAQGMMMTGTDTAKDAFPVWSGVVYLRSVITPQTINEYEAAFGGQTHVKNIADSGILGTTDKAFNHQMNEARINRNPSSPYPYDTGRLRMAMEILEEGVAAPRKDEESIYLQKEGSAKQENISFNELFTPAGDLRVKAYAPKKSKDGDIVTKPEDNVQEGDIFHGTFTSPWFVSTGTDGTEDILKYGFELGSENNQQAGRLVIYKYVPGSGPEPFKTFTNINDVLSGIKVYAEYREDIYNRGYVIF